MPMIGFVPTDGWDRSNEGNVGRSEEEEEVKNEDRVNEGKTNAAVTNVG